MILRRVSFANSATISLSSSPSPEEMVALVAMQRNGSCRPPSRKPLLEPPDQHAHLHALGTPVLVRLVEHNELPTRTPDHNRTEGCRRDGLADIPASNN